MGFSFGGLVKGVGLGGLINPGTALLGGLAGSGATQPSNGGVTTITAQPPAYLQPYLTDILNQAQGQYYGQPPQYFPGSTVAPFSQTTQQAMDLATQRAVNGSPVNNAAQNALVGQLGGANIGQGTQPFLNSLLGGMNSPGFQQAYQAAANQIIPQVGSLFGGANRLHSGLAQAAAAQGLGTAFGNLWGQAQNLGLQSANQLSNNQYLNSQQQQNAIGLAPSIANQSWNDIGQLANVGNMQDVMNQNQLTDQVNRFNYNQNLPFQQLQRYAGFTGAIPNSGGTQMNQAPQPGMLQRLLGGGLAGAGAGQMFGASGAGLSPWALGGLAMGGLL